LALCQLRFASSSLRARRGAATECGPGRAVHQNDVLGAPCIEQEVGIKAKQLAIGVLDLVPREAEARSIVGSDYAETEVVTKLDDLSMHHTFSCFVDPEWVRHGGERMREASQRRCSG
jgi:hypothetical protein